MSDNWGMETNVASWAERQWGSCKLGDQRLTHRAVAKGERIAAQPMSSLPMQMGRRAELVGSYRLLNNERVTAEALLGPHLRQTLAASRAMPVVLLIQDRTILNYTHHPATRGLGSVGTAEQRGFVMHSALAVNPTGKQVVGLAHVNFIVRPETQAPVRKGQRRASAEGQAWEKVVTDLGPVPATTRWIYVSDRESDIFDYLHQCRLHQAGFVIRAYKNRQQLSPAGDILSARTCDEARTWTAHPDGAYTVAVSATAQTPARTATLAVSWNTVTLHAPRTAQAQASVTVTMVRAWEPQPPAQVAPVEWLLLTSETLTTLNDVQRILGWYECRWLIEDFHQCLKTGCRVEAAQLDHGLDLQRLLGFLLPISVRLLQLRQEAQSAPEVPSTHVIEPSRIQLLAAHFQIAPHMTLHEFWQRVAQLGGHQGRKSDGPPDWRTLWRGWLKLDQWVYAKRLLPST